MTGPWKGAGASIGEGLALFANNFIQRQDQLRQQQIEEEQRRQQAAQIEMQNQRAAQEDELRRQQLEFQQQQYTDSRGDVQYGRDRQTRLDGLQTRDDEVKTALSPQVSAFMQGVSADLERYGPTTKDGKPNPQFNPALLQAAQDRSRQIKKLWSGVTLAVGSGEGYEEAKRALVGFVGGDVEPMTAAPAQPQTPMPAPAPVSVAEPGGASFNFTPEAAPAAPVMPAAPTAATAPAQNVRADLPADPNAMSITDLMKLTPAEINARYDGPTAENIYARRTQYVTEQAAEQKRIMDARADNWTEMLKKFDYSKMNPNQLAAINIIGQLNLKPGLDEEDQALMQRAFMELAPAVYTAENWAEIVKSGDYAKIDAMLGIYELRAPEVVRGFRDTALYQQAQAELGKVESDTTRNLSAAYLDDVNAGRITAKLPIELKQGEADLAATLTDTKKTNAEIKGIDADTAATQVDTTTAKYDLAVKKLSQIAATNATVYQIQKTNPQLWASLKRDMGVNDAGLTAILQEARFMNNLSVQEKELGIRKKASEILSEDASRGKTLAETGEIVTMLPIKAAEGTAKVDLTVAQTGQAQAATALSWTRNGEIEARLKIDRQKAAAYIKGVEGNYIVDMAQVKNLSARTALAQASDPNSPLYNPKIAAAKPGDPIATLKQKAGVYYTQQDNALQQADKVNTQINQLTAQYKNSLTGAIDLRKITPADKARLDSLTKQRDTLLKQAAGFRQQGDNVITKGMAALEGNAPNSGGTVPPVAGGKSPFKYLPAAPKVNIGTVTTALVNRMDNMLGGFKAPGGLIPVITQGSRTKEEQDRLYAQGRTAPGPIVTNAKGGESNHNGGNAVDISWQDPKTGKILAGTDPRAQAAWKALGAIAPQYGLRWGGTFKTADGKPFVDMYHFEVFGPFKAPATPAAKPAAPAARPAATAAPTTTAPPAGVKRPKLDAPSLAVASRAEQALIKSVKAGDGNTAYAMYTQLVNLGYDSGALLAYMQKNKVQK